MRFLRGFLAVLAVVTSKKKQMMAAAVKQCLQIINNVHTHTHTHKHVHHHHHTCMHAIIHNECIHKEKMIMCCWITRDKERKDIQKKFPKLTQIKESQNDFIKESCVLTI